MKVQFNGVTNKTVRDIVRGGKVVIPRETRVEVDDAALPNQARHNGKVYLVSLADMSSMEIQINGVYVEGCGPDAAR